jgi:hypothetical protein
VAANNGTKALTVVGSPIDDTVLPRAGASGQSLNSPLRTHNVVWERFHFAV